MEIIHSCTRVENPGEGVAQIFVWGGQDFPDKTAGGVLYIGFITFLLPIFFFLISLRGPILYSFPS
jgi:hypothetical protein